MTDLDFRIVYGALDLCDVPYAIEFGTDLGAPENVTQALAFLLQDGEIELSNRASNRTISFTVQVMAGDMAAQAAAEAALVLESEKPRNTLAIDPGDGVGAVTVFDTFRGQVTFNRDDNYEIGGLRRYTVTVRALPFGRSADEVVTEALSASGSTTTLVDDGSATTNWTGAVDGSSSSPSVSSGMVKLSSSSVTGDVTIALTRTASITTSSTNLIEVDWKPESPYGDPDLRAFGDGVELVRVAQIPSPTAGLTRSWFEATTSSIGVLLLQSTTRPRVPDEGAAVRSLYIDNINRTDVIPSIGTARQLLRSIDVPGSVRGPGAIAIEHSTTALGDVMAYFFPDEENTAGYSPPLRQYRISGGPTVSSDSAMVSGSKETLTSGTATFDVPYQRLAQGAHLLVVRLQAATPDEPVTTTITWTASTRVNSVDLGTADSGTAVREVGEGEIFTIGRPVLPTVDVDSASITAVVRITLTASAADAVLLDEGWLFNTTIGQLVGPISCGTDTAASGGPAKRLFLEPASANLPRPTIRIGDAADRSDSYFPTGALGGWQFPQLPPPRVNILTVTTKALGASVKLRGYKWAHTNVA